MDYSRASELASIQRRRHPAAAYRMLFARNFFKHPLMLGSVVPSSKRMMRRLLAPVDWGRATTFVEYGPGIGTITVELLSRMRSDARLLVLELNGEFVAHLKSRISDPRLIVVHRPAEEVGEVMEELGLPAADYIISGIPFSMMPVASRLATVRATAAALTGSGSFLVYQFSNRVERYLGLAFGRIDRDFELWNVPPARLYDCRKG